MRVGWISENKVQSVLSEEVEAGSPDTQPAALATHSSHQEFGSLWNVQLKSAGCMSLPLSEMFIAGDEANHWTDTGSGSSEWLVTVSPNPLGSWPSFHMKPLNFPICFHYHPVVIRPSSTYNFLPSARSKGKPGCLSDISTPPTVCSEISPPLP